MNTVFVNALKTTLQKTLVLLNELPNEAYTNNSVGPFYSTIGGHIRHILSIYSAINKGVNLGVIDLTYRERGSVIETDIDLAIQETQKIISYLDIYNSLNLNDLVELIDDFGEGKLNVSVNLYAALSQANSHTIHHYAVISQLLFSLNITITDKTFGYNPTTPIPGSTVVEK